MVIYGILALFQITFLPGAIVIRLLKFKGFLRSVIISFGLSLLINFQIVLLLTCLGLYKRNILLSIFAAEFMLLIFLYRKILTIPVNVPITRLRKSVVRFNNDYFGFGGAFQSTSTSKLILVTRTIAFFSACGFLVWYFWIYGRQYNNVFTVWDAIVSWDRWALDWYQGKLPSITWHYPQLIPTAWSLTYIFIDEPIIKQFARWLMGVFEIFIPLTFFIMGWLKRSSAYFWGCTVSAWLFLKLGSQAFGNVDTALACLSLIAISCLLLAFDEADARQHFLLVFFGALIAAASAMTKQAGLWTVFIFPIFYSINHSKDKPYRLTRRQWLMLISLVFLAVGPWNIYKQVQITMGLDSSELSTIVSFAHNNRNLSERAVFAYLTLKEHLGGKDYLLYFYLISSTFLMAFSLKIQKIRWILFLINIPHILVWIFMLSYDERNLTYVLPFIGLSMGVGLDWLVSNLSQITPNLLIKLQNHGYEFAQPILSIRIWLVGLMLLFGLALLPLRYPNSYLKQSAIDQEKEIGFQSLNTLLYDYYDKNGFQGKILSDYQILFGLPEIKDYYRFAHSNQPTFIQQLGLPEISYALYCVKWASPELSTYMNKELANGEYRLIFQIDCWQMVSLCKDTCK
jgi:hypothetical protein